MTTDQATTIQPATDEQMIDLSAKMLAWALNNQDEQLAARERAQIRFWCRQLERIAQ